jgi:hypothetical protein
MNWVQVGKDIDGEHPGYNSGRIATSEDGQTVSIGASYISDSYLGSGHVHTTLEWHQSGTTRERHLTAKAVVITLGRLSHFLTMEIRLHFVLLLMMEVDLTTDSFVCFTTMVMSLGQTWCRDWRDGAAPNDYIYGTSIVG